MNKLLLAVSTLLLSTSAFAQDLNEPKEENSAKRELISLSADARVDYQPVSWDGTTASDNTGFEGKYFMFRVDGEIIPGLTYSWRQRLNKMHTDGNFFDATDWVYLDWRYKDFSFQAGKQIVAIGGWEYDRNPIDLYGTSVFWQNIGCYQLGASAGYHFSDRDFLMAQVTQSPSHTKENRNMYAYNLIWYGNHGWYQSIWSANMLEYLPGKYINYVALGNKFNYRNVSLELDYMNRASETRNCVGKDCSVMTELAWTPNQRWRLHGKYTYDVNKTDNNGDVCVLSGTKLNMIGGGIEFFPLIVKHSSLRLHANCYYGWGTNTNTADFMQDKSIYFTVGLKWHMDIFSLKH
jgi:hypothetical protein